MVLNESTATMPTTRSPMRRAASSATGAPIEWPTSTTFRLVKLADDGRDILTEIAHRPVRAVRTGCAVTAEIDRHGGVLRLQRSDLLFPVIAVARPAVDEHDRRLAAAIHVILDVHAIGRRDDLR